MIVHSKISGFRPYDAYLNGELVDPAWFLADDEAGFIIMMLKAKGSHNFRMIGADIDRPEIESPLYYKLEGKVELKEQFETSPVGVVHIRSI